MVSLHFTQNIQRHIRCPEKSVEGATVREALDNYFADLEGARTYVLDDQGALRHHVMIFVDGTPVMDRTRLSDPVRATSELYVIQALSGG